MNVSDHSDSCVEQFRLRRVHLVLDPNGSLCDSPQSLPDREAGQKLTFCLGESYRCRCVHDLIWFLMLDDS